MSYPPPAPGQYPPAPPTPGQYSPPPPPPGGYYFNPPPPQASRGTPVAIVVAFVGVLALVAVVVGVIVLANQPPPPVTQCQPDVPCAPPPPSGRPISNASPTPTSGVPSTPRSTTAVPATIGPASPPPSAGPSPDATPATTPIVVPPTPTSDSPPATSGEVVQNDALGYSFEYQGEDWTLDESDDPNRTILNGVFFDAQIVIEAAPASVTVAQMLERQLTSADRFTLGRAPDNDSYDAVLGPGIGYIRGDGAVYSGTLVGRDGTPIEPVGLTLVASTNGRITVAVMVIAGQPDLRLGADTHQFAVRSSAGLILKTFDWDLTQ
ncbi:MAG: hypothetical protein ABIP53_06635 [Candidatus Limnocylindrales bacterium]